MSNNEQIAKLFLMVNERISPYKLTISAEDKLQICFKKYDFEFIQECILISSSQYLQFDNTGKPTSESANTFIQSITGIAHNKSRDPISEKISHINNSGKRGHQYSYWNPQKASELLWEYVDILRVENWEEAQIAEELDTICLKRLLYNSKSWTQWRQSMESLIDVEKQNMETNI